jgi:hypothetical protein
MQTETQRLYHRDGHEQTFSTAAISRMASCGQVGGERLVLSRSTTARLAA